MVGKNWKSELGHYVTFSRHVVLVYWLQTAWQDITQLEKKRSKKLLVQDSHILPKKIKMFWSNYIPNFWQFRKRIYPIGLIIWTPSHLSSQPSSTLPHLSNLKPQEGIILGSSMDTNRFRSSPLFSACLMPVDREWFQIWQETLNWHVCR